MDRHAINFSWLLRLRWGAIAGQVGIILGADRLLGIDLPLLPLFAVMAFEAASNVASARWARDAREIREWMIGSLMALDVLVLTALLYLTGGPYNPFTFLYLVNVALAAVVLRPRWTWGLVALSLISFGALFANQVSLPDGHLDSAGHAEHLRMHLEGMWVAFGVAAAFIVYFVQRLTRALAAREAELAAARSLTARNERLASLGTLAAGAAHQLATPLSTIAVIAKELERQLERKVSADDAVADVRLIREQVERCRDILLQMAADAGESTGEAIVSVRVGELVETALRGISATDRARVMIETRSDGGAVTVPVRSVAQALRAVLKNALEASQPSAPVRVDVSLDEDSVRIDVCDHGSGMSAEVLQHAGEPFFTTKGPDGGMGLGLFLTRAVLERLGGRFALQSAPQKGTTATLILPLALPAIGGHAAPPQQRAS